jgi:hypothetical protein
MNKVFVQIIRSLSSFVNSPGHYAAAVTIMLWALSSRMLGTSLDFRFCLFFVISYWLVGVALIAIKDFNK